MKVNQVLAIDLGASNGCLMVVTLDNGQIHQKEIHRFSNEMIEENEHLYWDITKILHEIKEGLKLVSGEITGIGIDTWGVDIGLIGKNGELLEKPFSYRDTHTVKAMEKVHQQIEKSTLFKRTGVESSPINTLYQLKAIYAAYPTLIEEIDTILTFPNVINYLLTGMKRNEFTHASTTQMLHSTSKEWDEVLLEEVFDFVPPLAPLYATSSVIGLTKKEVNETVGMKAVPVIQVPGHDTACALAAIPKIERGAAFMSCGTWILAGVEVESPIVTEEAYTWEFTNEGTAEGTYRLQKNNMGLWLLQQCKREWEAKGESITYEHESELVKTSEPFRSFVDPDDAEFFNPDSMIDVLQQYCKQTNQPIPETKGQIIRCIVESLAMKHCLLFQRIEHLIEQSIPSIHMVGGGIQNEFLCQFIANATQKIVYAGPIEASSLGNALSQFIALGEIENWQEAKEIVVQSYEVKKYEKENVEQWESNYKRFKKIIKKYDG